MTIITIESRHHHRSLDTGRVKLPVGGCAWQCLTFYVLTRLLAHTALDNFLIVLSVRLFSVINSMGWQHEGLL